MTGQVWQIRVRGHLGSQWQELFDGLTIANVEDGEAIVSGPLADQAALYGVLLKIHDIGLALIGVTSTQAGDLPSDDIQPLDAS